jgi:tRNA 5-methylaminomethyl-2-thiouridine biosynthesis bifunctional protein
MARVDQRPHKRESLAGTFARAGLSGFPPPPRVTVVGGGLAGASTARQLADAGCRVTLIDPGECATAEQLPATDPVNRPASNMPATVVHARLLAGATPTALLRCHGYLFACAVLPGLPGFQATGVLQLAGAGQPPAKLAELAAYYAGSGRWLRWLEPAEAAELAGWPVTAGGLHLPAAGVVNIPVMVDALTRHPNVEVLRTHWFEQSRAGSARGRERDLAAEHKPGDPLVLACGASTPAFPAARYLEIAAVHGQLDLVVIEAAPQLPLVGRGYLVPSGDGLLAAGSTYEYRPWDPQAASRANLAQLAGHRYRWRYRCRGTRSVSSDRTAIAGPLFDPDCRAVPDLYVTTGHGSAGNVSTHLAAALLTAHITGDCPPLQRGLEAALSPLRFRERQARRGYRHNARD